MAQAKLRTYFERKIGASLTRTVLTGTREVGTESGRRFTCEILAVDDYYVTYNLTSYQVTPDGTPYDTTRSRIHYGDGNVSWDYIAGLEDFWVHIVEAKHPDYAHLVEAQPHTRSLNRTA